MKKILLATLLLPLVAMMSCLKSDSVDYSGLNPGINIYNMVSSQATLDKDPIRIMFKLNMLIETAAEKNKSISEVTVKIEEAETNLKNYLFGDSAITNVGEAEWTIVFNQGSAGRADPTREGKVTIFTNGKTLSELDEGESWEFVGDLNGYAVVLAHKFFSNYGSYFMRREAGNEWRVYGNSNATYEGNTNSDIVARWTFEYSVTMFGGGEGLTFESVVEDRATFEFDWAEVGGTGNPVGVSSKFDYMPRNLKYKPSCLSGLWYGGTENVTLIEPVINTDAFPTRSVVYSWVTSTSDPCSNGLQINYNGYTYDVASGYVTGY